MPSIVDARRGAFPRHFRILFIAASALAWSAAAGADDAAQEIEARYREELAACEQAPAGTDREACRREAAAARAEARRGAFADTPGDLERNALARCNALPEADRELCRRRTRGEGVTRGSVSEGGIYREYREAILPPKDPSGAQETQPSR